MSPPGSALPALAAWVDAHAALVWCGLVLAGGLVLAARARVGRATPAWPGRGALATAGLISAAAFAAVAWAVASGSGLVVLDQGIADGLAIHLPAAWLPAVLATTRIGDAPVLAAVTVLVALLLLVRRRWLLAAAWIAGVAGAGLLVRACKPFVARARPLDGVVAEHGFSFPSGHSAGSLAVYGLLAWLLARQLRPGRRAPVVLAAALLVLAVGVSRILLRVHFASDVLGGWLLALAWTACVVCAVERGRSED